MARNRTSLTYPDGGSVSYGYDTANRLSGMTDWNGRNTTFSYDNVGRRVGLNMPNGTKASYNYDPAGRLTDLSHKTGGGSIIDSFSYTYNQVGNRLSVMMPNEKLSYAYDLLDRLIEAVPTKLQGTDITMGHKAEAFKYDPVGNRITGPEAIDTYVYNQGNQLISDRKNQYQYDRNGNLISKTEVDDAGSTKNWTYAYDAENRLIKVIKQEVGETKTITFKYDPFGRRIEKKVEGIEAGIAGTKIYSDVYDNEDIIAEYLTKTENGISRTETTKYLHGLGIDEPLEIDRKGAIYYYHADGLGSITALSDSSQKAMERYSYSSFGDLKRQGDKVKNTYTLTGREWDEEIGLYYYRARYYGPVVGRFISRDPLGFEGGETNLYSAMRNNPIILTDPMGLSPDCKKKCIGKARVLKGNSKLIGRQGGFGVTVTAGSAAVIPSQWGGKAQLRPYLGQISGSCSGASFSGITDVIGGESPCTNTNVRDCLQSLNPGLLILELPSLSVDLGVVQVELTVPSNFSCPTGTVEKQ